MQPLYVLPCPTCAELCHGCSYQDYLMKDCQGAWGFGLMPLVQPSLCKPLVQPSCPPAPSRVLARRRRSTSRTPTDGGSARVGTDRVGGGSCTSTQPVAGVLQGSDPRA